jgi:hypothetical protein
MMEGQVAVLALAWMVVFAGVIWVAEVVEAVEDTLHELHVVAGLPKGR